MSEKITVGMDISQIAHQGGVAVYTENLALQLQKIPGLEMVYFYSSLRKPYKGRLRNVKLHRLPPTLFEMLFNRWRNIGIEKFIGPVDIFHSSDWTQPPTKAKKVTTFHDLIPIKYPDWSHPKVIEVFKRRLKLVEREIDIVIVVSESTKNDLMKISHIPSEKIKVVYEGVEEYFKPQSQEEIGQFKSKYNLPDKFVLAVGGVGKRKNIDKIKEASKGYNLIILGQDIQIPREDLPLLYTGAGCLLYASLYEGFGLPILEAMACGTPVITSNTSSMPEVGGEAVVYVNPQDVDDIEKKLKAVMGDKDLREKLIKKGFIQAKKFSREKAAHDTTAVYRELVND